MAVANARVRFAIRGSGTKRPQNVSGPWVQHVAYMFVIPTTFFPIPEFPSPQQSLLFALDLY